MDKIRRLKRKKGFTLIELIIVLAIIGILSALLIPTLLADRRPEAGKSYAKDFFYCLQSYVSGEKLAGNTWISDAADGNADDAIILYINIGKDWKPDPDSTNGNMVMFSLHDCGIADLMESDLTKASSFDKTDPVDKPKYDFFAGMMRKLNTSLEDPEYDGMLYAVVDKEYRVQAAYWTETQEWTEVRGGVFENNCELTKGDIINICASYPPILCTPTGTDKDGNAADKVIFNYKDFL